MTEERVEVDAVSLGVSIGCLIVTLAALVCVIIASLGIGWWMIRGTYSWAFGGGI